MNTCSKTPMTEIKILIWENWDEVTHTVNTDREHMTLQLYLTVSDVFVCRSNASSDSISCLEETKTRKSHEVSSCFFGYTVV